MQHICYIVGAYHGEACPIYPAHGDMVIAADGGYAALQALGITPHLVVGDFDSLGYVPESEDVIRHPVRKADTDTLLAIRLGLEQGYRSFVITGSVGGRLDHTIANVQTLLFLMQHGARGLLYGDGTAVTSVRNGSITLQGKGLFSVFALDPIVTGVQLDGVAYPLRDGVLTYDFPLGASNEFGEGPACIGAENGTLLVIWQPQSTDLQNTISIL